MGHSLNMIKNNLFCSVHDITQWLHYIGVPNKGAAWYKAWRRTLTIIKKKN